VSEIACFTSFSIARLDAVIHPLIDKIKIRGECFSLTPAIFCLPFHLPFAPVSRTGKMPVPQKINFLVEQASCLFIKA
jgi:hypothetical protein